MSKNFCSDNTSGASPEIVAALADAAAGPAMPYGDDPWTARLEARLKEIFETDLAAFPVATGTAANALALGTITPPFGAVYCHPDSHIYADECGAPEFYTGGAKLVTMAGDHGKFAADDLALLIRNAGLGVVHHVQPAAVTITQATEAGTLYSAGEISALAKVAHTHRMALHMDGARFANAVAAMDCAPADITWRAGVDVMSFGATKNGALAAEVVVFFNAEMIDTGPSITGRLNNGGVAEFGYRRKRGAHLFSKMRFLSAQLEAYLTDDLWLKNAAHANAMAARLAQGLGALPGVEMLHPVEANEVFLRLPQDMIARLKSADFLFYEMGPKIDPHVRLVASWDTTQDDVAGFLAVAGG